MFPDKTSQIWQIDPTLLTKAIYSVEWRFESEAEFIHLAQLKDLLDSCDATLEVRLLIPYLPYARQDKIVSNDTCFALYSFSKLLNSLAFSEVQVFDAHSEEASKMILNFWNCYPRYLYPYVINELNPHLICYADEGAFKKYRKSFGGPYLYGIKTRESSTGLITDLTLSDAALMQDKTVLIVDDICDGGKTFLLLAAALYNAGAIEVNLYVTHGIFSRGTDVLRYAGIKRIFTYKGEKHD